MKEIHYDYHQNSDGLCPGPGWRLYKYIPSIYNSKRDIRVEGGTFIFERAITYTSNSNDVIRFNSGGQHQQIEGKLC